MKSKIIKPIIRLLTICILLFFQAITVKAQSTFNGKMKFKVQNNGGKDSFITYFFQNGKMRADLPVSAMGGKTYMIFKGKSMYVVIPSQKMYMEYSGSFNKLMKYNPAMKSNSGLKKGNKKKTNWKEIWKRAKTGKTKKILGYLCNQYILPNENGGSMQIWVTNELGDISLMQNPMSPNPVLSEIKKMGGYFPLLTEEYNTNGKVVSKFQVVEVKKEKLTQNLFILPKGYKKMTVPGMK